MGSITFPRLMTRLAPLAVALVVAVAPAGAQAASTATLSNGTLTITGGAEDNDISFGGNSFLQEYVEDSAGLTAGSGCSQVAPTEVDCPGYGQIVARLGPGSDRFLAGMVSDVRMTISGEDGDDTIYGGSGADTIDGGPGNDFIDGNGGHDTADGGAGDDTLWAGGDATITGGPGRDSLNGGARNQLDSGNSTVYANDGEVDQVSCGVFGTSIVYADQIDVVDPSCTQVHREGGGTPDVTPMAVTLGGAPARMRIAALLRDGYRFRCTVSAPGALGAQLVLSAAQAARLHLPRRSTPIAQLTSRVDASAYRVTLRVRARYRRAVGRARRFTARLVVMGVDAAGHQDRAGTSVTFTR